MGWIKIFATADAAKSKIPDRGMQLVKVGNKMIFIARMGDDFFAADNDCPHQGGFLHEGNVSFRGEVICPWHHYRFSLRDGAETSGKHCPPLNVYEVKIDDSGFFIDISL